MLRCYRVMIQRCLGVGTYIYMCQYIRESLFDELISNLKQLYSNFAIGSSNQSGKQIGASSFSVRVVHSDLNQQEKKSRDKLD